MDIKIFLSMLLFGTLACSLPEEDENPLNTIMQSDETSIKTVMDSLEQYELQIVFTPVEKKDGKFVPGKRHTFGLDTTRYFYPASTVKMPVAFLALQRLKELRDMGYSVTRDMPVYFGAGREPMTEMIHDSCSSTGLPSIASFIEQVFTVSDNNSYVRLYEFLGQEYINRELRNKDIFTNSRIITRVGVSGFSTEENRYVNPFYFGDPKDPVYKEDLRYSVFDLSISDSLTHTHKGLGYIDQNGEEIQQPFDMSEKNFISLADLERSLMVALFPEWFPEISRYNIDKEDYAFLMATMEKLPKDFACYADTSKYYDGYVKFFMFGDSKEPIPDHITIKNKVGFAYGTLTDCSYIEDAENDVRFFLTATMLVNQNGIFNDGVYEYKTIGQPFMAELGRKVYQYMLSIHDDVEME